MNPKPSITTWTRLEPRARGDDLSPSLEARVHDPAWLLGRQWQLGEFVGEDAGSPVHVRLEVEPDPIVAYRVGGVDAAFRPDAPVDVLVGAEPQAASTLAERAEAGAELLDLLAEAGCSAAGTAALVGDARLPPAAGARISSEGEPSLSLAAGRLPDGGALAPVLEAIAASGRAPAALGLSASDASAIVTAARAWISWRATLVQRAPASSWVDAQLEHTFRLGVNAAGNPAYALVAPAWDGDRLDWYDIEIDRAGPVPAPPAGTPAPPLLEGVDPVDGLVKRAGLPTPLAYPGMPASRWWQFEDARVNFAQVAAHPEDLARMLLLEFASVYGNDWYLWPLVLPVGAVHRITRFEVTHTFSDVLQDVVQVAPAGAPVGGATDADWQLFRPTDRSAGAAGAGAGLVLLPTLASPVDGEILEEVRFLRDELANLAWGVEATVRGDDGLPRQRIGAAAAPQGAPPAGAERPADPDAPLRWQLTTDVPVHWFPFAPDPSGAPKLRRLVVPRVDDHGAPADVRPEGVILAPADLWVWQEEVPREGARVVRRHRMARGEDGRPYVWIARRSETGRGEGSSALRYDDALPAGAEPSP
jgi:hypothetical protein